MVSLVLVHIAKKLVVPTVCAAPFQVAPPTLPAHLPSCSLLLRPMDTQTGHLTAFSGGETMDRRGVGVRKPMFEPDWEDTSAWAVYREAVLGNVLERRITY